MEIIDKFGEIKLERFAPSTYALVSSADSKILGVSVIMRLSCKM